MAKHIWSVLCRRGILDKYTNSVSIVDVLESITFEIPEPIEEGKKWVLLPETVAIVSLVIRSDYREPEKSSLKIHVEAPTGETFRSESASEIELVDHVRSRAFTVLPVVPFWQSGIHWFCVSFENEKGEQTEVARLPLDMRQKEHEKDN